jgi:hypothetical protein
MPIVDIDGSGCHKTVSRNFYFTVNHDFERQTKPPGSALLLLREPTGIFAVANASHSRRGYISPGGEYFRGRDII